jgi:hypothetical protein
MGPKMLQSFFAFRFRLGWRAKRKWQFPFFANLERELANACDEFEIEEFGEKSLVTGGPRPRLVQVYFTIVADKRKRNIYLKNTK